MHLVSLRSGRVTSGNARTPVGVRHAVRVFALLDRGAAVVGGIQELARQPLGHGVLGARARQSIEPADRQRLRRAGADLDRNLIGRAADAARPHLDGGLHVVERVVEDLDRVLPGLLADDGRARRRRCARRPTSCRRTSGCS